jgi:cell division protein FtsX
MTFLLIAVVAILAFLCTASSLGSYSGKRSHQD